LQRFTEPALRGTAKTACTGSFCGHSKQRGIDRWDIDGGGEVATAASLS
jgi:hypothetical protein